MEVPLILTVTIEQNAFRFFDALRKIYYPNEGNIVHAHLTLFHLLPNEPSILDDVADACRQFGTLNIQIKEPILTGNGIAYKIECPELLLLHKTLQQQWHSFLIPQDHQKLCPHITIQNKATPEAAKELQEFLQQNFCAFTAKGTGLQLWEYHNGPWKLFKEFEFVRN